MNTPSHYAKIISLKEPLKSTEISEFFKGKQSGEEVQPVEEAKSVEETQPVKEVQPVGEDQSEEEAKSVEEDQPVEKKEDKSINSMNSDL